MADDDPIKLDPSWKSRIGDYLQREDMAALGIFLRQRKAQGVYDGALQISFGCAAARHPAALPLSSRWARRTGRRAFITTSSLCASSRSAVVSPCAARTLHASRIR